MLEDQFFICDCHSDECTLRVGIDADDPDWPMFSIHVFLADLTFWKRIRLGIKYILGYKSRCGCFGEWLLQDADVVRFICLLEKYKEKRLEMAKKIGTKKLCQKHSP